MSGLSGSLLGIMYLYARLTEHHSTLNVFLAGAGMKSPPFLVSYTTAHPGRALSGEKANVEFSPEA
ncbi:MAG: hypothetical protein IPG58_17065 [Acidobacteria bacterium]|nr:hypothetical protein [Acidobacteriota bacterium]